MKKSQAIILIFLGVLSILSNSIKIYQSFTAEEPPIQRIETRLTDSTGISIVYIDEKVTSKPYGTSIFFRRRKDKNACELVFRSTNNSGDEHIIRQVSEQNSENRTDLFHPQYLTLSLDEEKAYCMLELAKELNQSILAEIDIQHQQLRALFPVDQFRLIKTGKHKGNLLVEVQMNEGAKKHKEYYIKDVRGNTLKEFSDYNDYRQFRNRLN